MSTTSELLINLQNAPDGLSLAQLLVLHPNLSRRTAQRWLAELVIAGHAKPEGQGRARRYVVGIGAASVNTSVNASADVGKLVPQSRDPEIDGAIDLVVLGR